MINAYEAKQLAANSQQEVDKILEELDQLIRKAAYKGERILSYHKGRCYWREDDYESEKINTPFVNLICEKLRTYGFGTSMGRGESYKIGMDDDEHYNVFLKISW